jgi:hypothetical protein
MSETTQQASNNEAFLAGCKDNILSNLRIASGAGKESLTAFAQIGQDLLEAKEAIGHTPRGAFGTWCEANFPFSKEWRARLMKLAGDWKAIRAAMAWAESKGQVLGRKEYSVDGAFALLADYLAKAEISDIEADCGPEYADRAREAEAKAADKEQAKADKAEAKGKEKSEAETLREQLAEALERIRALEDELRIAKGGKAKPEAKQAPGVDAATKARARKIYALATKGATEGERGAAMHKLADIATKLGLTLEAFLEACGLEPLDYQQAA